MTQLVLLDGELSAIRSFLDRVAASVDTEYREVKKRAESGVFDTPDDEANALYTHFTSEQIAIRAVLSELNSIVERQLQSLAVIPLREQQQGTGHTKKLASDLGRDKLCSLIEGYYKVSIPDLPGSAAVEDVRRKINAYKHRGGFKDPRRDYDVNYFPEKFELEREQTRFYIQAVRDFFEGIWGLTKSCT